MAKLHENEQRWVPIVDPGIKVDPGYTPYDRGIQQDVFMKGVDGKPYLGWVRDSLVLSYSMPPPYIGCRESPSRGQPDSPGLHMPTNRKPAR